MGVGRGLGWLEKGAHLYKGFNNVIQEKLFIIGYNYYQYIQITRLLLQHPLVIHDKNR